MTKEEIVSILEEQAQKKYDSASFVCMNDGAVLMEAAKMLRDQQAPAKLGRSLLDGCFLCKDATYLDGDVCVSGTHYVRISEFGFCPNCGRPLTDGACSKLEEHIGGYYISIESYDKCVDTLKAKLYDMDKEIEGLKAELERRINCGTNDDEK